MPEPTILDTILAHKQGEVAARKAKTPFIEEAARNIGWVCRDFHRALLNPPAASVALIAEVKKASPSAGVIRPGFDPVQIARVYEQSGAACLSVLTDEHFFQGHDTYLTTIRTAVDLPLLRKEFIVDAFQIYEARVIGADAVLLIAAALGPAQLADYRAIAGEIGMAALVEVHTEAEMAVALGSGARLIGINSRDLNTFVTDLGTVERLAAMVPDGVTLVAESGIKTPADVKLVADAGAKGCSCGRDVHARPRTSGRRCAP